MWSTDVASTAGRLMGRRRLRRLNGTVKVCATCSPSVARAGDRSDRDAGQLLGRLHREHRLVLEHAFRRTASSSSPARRPDSPRARQGEAFHRIALFLLNRVRRQRLQQRGTGLVGVRAPARRRPAAESTRPRSRRGSCSRRKLVSASRGFVLRVLVVGQHPGDAGEITRRVRRVGQEVAAAVDVRHASSR